ncbi:MAG: PLD nuclease N-terminal domain-containing protein [Ruminococcus sp.]|nr:PLD nuclease N-terminal domain-containing protein [Ruminococcus sp.]
MGKKWLRELLARPIIIILLIVLQVGLIVYFIASRGLASKIISRTLTVLSVLVCLYILSKKEKGGFKLTWVFLILLFPVFGGILYLLFNRQISTRRVSEKIAKIDDSTRSQLILPDTAYSEVKEEMQEYATLM